MNKKVISSSDFISWLNKITGKTVWKACHVSDGLLFFYLGDKVKENQIDKNGKATEVEIGEYVLHINGDWSYLSNDRGKIDRQPQNDESRTHYFQKIESFADDFPFTTVDSVRELNKNTVEMLFANKDRLSITSSDDGGFISLHKNETKIDNTYWNLAADGKNLMSFELLTNL